MSEKTIAATRVVKRIEFDHATTGQNARDVREFYQLSVRECAKRMGISAMYLSDLERGRRNWSEGLVELFEKAAR